jgi:hypothetical protein
MEAVVERGNMRKAYRWVVGNKGAAGVDAMGVDGLKPYLLLFFTIKGPKGGGIFHNHLT